MEPSFLSMIVEAMRLQSPRVEKKSQTSFNRFVGLACRFEVLYLAKSSTCMVPQQTSEPQAYNTTTSYNPYHTSYQL